MKQRGLIDLADKMDTLVKRHPAVAEAWEITHAATDHLRLLAAFRDRSAAALRALKGKADD